MRKLFMFFIASLLILFNNLNADEIIRIPDKSDKKRVIFFHKEKILTGKKLAEKLAKIGHSKATEEFIKNNIRKGSSKIIKKDILKRILIGQWRFNEFYSVIFKKDGTFSTYQWDVGVKFEYAGKWKVVKDNIVNFKVKGSKKWQLCKINEIILGEEDEKKYSYFYLALVFNDVFFKTSKRHELFLGGGNGRLFLL